MELSKNDIETAIIYVLHVLKDVKKIVDLMRGEKEKILKNQMNLLEMKNLIDKSGQIWSNWGPHVLLAGMQNDTAILEHSFVVSYKTKHTLIG